MANAKKDCLGPASKSAKAKKGQMLGKSGSGKCAMKKYTMSEIAASTSLAVINGAVVDLSSWVNQHPAGSSPIQGLIGTDGSDAFNARHGGNPLVARKLKQLTVGVLDPNATTIEKTFTMAQVAGSTSLTVIDNNVYDLSNWVNQHPGGPSAIESLIGKDGTLSFRNMHGNSVGPNSKLESFRVGVLTA